MRNAIALILGGGRGTRLSPLTGIRSKPAVPLAGKYRLIDIPISNCLNSEITRIYVLTQFMSVSLHTHIRQTYVFDSFRGGFVELLAATETDSPKDDPENPGTDWFQGTADAVRKNLRYLQDEPVDYVVILSGDQLYRMDYQKLLETHQKTKADVTIAAIPVDRKDAGALGIMRCDENGKVVGFLEKPQKQEELDLVRTDPAWIDAHGVPSNGRDCLASMGIYIFNRDVLVNALLNTNYKDFGKEVFPAAIRSRHVQVHLFDDYWEDIGTIRSFYEANLSLASSNPPFSFYTPEAPVYSRARFLPPTQMAGATIKNSLIADGCRIGEGSVVENSVIGLRSSIGNNVTIKNSIIMGADMWDSDLLCTQFGGTDKMPLGIGDGTLIDGAIIDKNCRIGTNVRIVNQSNIANSDEHPPCVIRDGIPILIKNSVLPNDWSLQ